MPRVSVIIVNYNAGDRLARCLSHLKEQTFQDFETIVIDNGSQDQSLALARNVGLDATFIEAGENLGFAVGNNRAVEQAQGKWVAFLNPDAYAAPDWLAALIGATQRHPGVDAFGSLQLDAADPNIIDGAGDVFHALGVAYRGHFGWSVDKVPGEGECFAPCAAAALYKTETFRSLGGFDEDFFCYCEDVDLGFRLRLAGGRAVQVPDAKVLHEGSGISGRYSDFTVYHGNRNRIWMVYKNLPAILLWPLAPIQFGVNLFLLVRAWQSGFGSAYLRGLKDGYAGLPARWRLRRSIQKNRQIDPRQLMRVITWSPRKIRHREGRLDVLATAEG